MHMQPNRYLDKYKARFGVPTISPLPGETFDVNNDLTLGADGRTVYHRDGHVSYGGTGDALLVYDKRHMLPSYFEEHWGGSDERSESMMLHGCA